MSKINETLFKRRLKKIKGIYKIEKVQTQFKIIFNDGVELMVRNKDDGEYHLYYTYMNIPCSKYYYFDHIGIMPHNTITDLYEEIERMADNITRKMSCKYPYFKSY
ncbi:hypothetical protein Indivirus_2_52 [Indivirus ILV1]|uniref:Uncharacterized protein n=1 Tax=Indivirus ILV1 TaxID=1977633 RepID=A0A1V0SD73_9VIRU|nr:hypothetical protein Indivirus_2_52 [Indivirus ILV1]